MVFKRTLILWMVLASGSLVAQEGQEAGETQRKISYGDSTKSNYKSGLRIGAPTNKAVEIELNDYKAPFYRWDLTFTNHWFDLKKKVNEKTGLALSINYTGIFMGASHKIAEENQQTAASGILDITLKWNFINRNKDENKGSLIFWTDWRHLYYGEVGPQFLFLETGSGTMGATKFNKFNFHMLEFYYQQAFLDNRMGLVIGKIDMADWFAYNGLAHPMLHFTDLAFSVGPTTSWSNPGFGIAAGGWIDKQKRFGLVVGLNDVAGVDLANPAFFDMGFDQWKNTNFLKMAELHYTPKRAQYYFNRVSLTLWHSDELATEDNSYFTSPSSKGFSVQGTWVFEDKYIPVFTFGMSDGNGANTLSRINVSMMNGWYFPSHDMLGIGLNYSESTISGEGQFLSEIFYRFTLSKTTSWTPLVKLVVNPALNPDVGIMIYYGIRGRISL